jgi:hypothetical protein
LCSVWTAPRPRARCAPLLLLLRAACGALIERRVRRAAYTQAQCWFLESAIAFALSLSGLVGEPARWARGPRADGAGADPATRAQQQVVNVHFACLQLLLAAVLAHKWQDGEPRELLMDSTGLVLESIFPTQRDLARAAAAAPQTPLVCAEGGRGVAAALARHHRTHQPLRVAGRGEGTRSHGRMADRP